MEVKKPTQLAALRQWLEGSRYLLCVDLEATCDDYPEGLSESERELYQLQVPRDEMETIEIGAVLIDLHRAGEVVAEFESFVRPVLHSKLTAFCTQLTTIEQSDVDGAAGYADVASQIREFLTPYAGDVQWCSWGDYDRKQLLADAQRLGCEAMLDSLNHASMKRWHWKLFACRGMGLKPAAESLALKWQGQYHRGIDDARNLTAIVKRMVFSS
ncbi:exonuclease [Pseudomonas syringae pv. actinidiae]|uniref:3'-5' exonuclease n=1 Tax=Pseudomonas syringae TaxID=317 RepID=UPI000BB5501C|nr:3'-5' exonuclease [Pseudomonas syringae]PBK49101.1 exonuclease [Pseudomonas syringae pv. actinidiae]PBK49140.1 exonuclease [Pseudomonas syringae pv. actinidiae]RJX55234.1 exonuclease [Pseudomonas syringae pv. actinidiae]RJX56387.1 exonuclease [Pseudomonas syringae pv. actinidiae]RJX60637.1 exonuclease [Pseudomonas syringae pv. actinidiae]